MSDPVDIYRELLAGARLAPGHAYREFAGPAGLVVRAFVDGLTRLPGVSLQVSADSVPGTMQLPRMKGASATVSSEGKSELRRVTYLIVAAEPVYATVFVELAAKLIAEACAMRTPSEALTSVARRLAAWARFFDSRTNEGLGRSAQLGLIGELICLQELARHAGFPSAVLAWNGPSSSLHDFQVAAGAIEVKLTTTSAPERFRITSERQLDDSAVPALLLCAISAQEQPSGPIGLPDMVDSVRAKTEQSAPAQIAALEERLLEAGYSECDRSAYTVRVSIRHVEFAHVTGDFPRVTPTDVRNGVFAVSYEIPRSAILPFLVPPSRAGELIRAAD